MRPSSSKWTAAHAATGKGPTHSPFPPLSVNLQFQGMGKGKKPAKGGSRVPRDGEDSDSGSEEDTKRPVERSVGKQRSNVGMMPPSDSESGSDEEEGEPKPAPKGKAAHGGQPATAGMLPPSDSEGEDEDEEDESDDEDEGATAVRCANPTPAGAHLAALRRRRHQLPCAPASAAAGVQMLLRVAAASKGCSVDRAVPACGACACREKRAAAPVEKSAKEIAAELAKLELVRKRRCVRSVVACSCAAALLCHRSAHRLLLHRADQAAQRIASEGFDRFAPK